PEAYSAQDDRGTEEDRQLGPLECPVVPDGLIGQNLSYPKLVDASLNVLWSLAVEVGTRSGSLDGDPANAGADSRIPARTNGSELSDHLALSVDRPVGQDPVARVGRSCARPSGDRRVANHDLERGDEARASKVRDNQTGHRKTP